LKAVLLDQKAVAGVGNIYADEALFAAKLSPTLRGCDATPAETDRLRKAVARVLARAIEYRGSSIRDYVGGAGQKGGFQDEFTVYGRTGKSCPRCGETVVRTVIAGRSTHYCPECQKIGVRGAGRGTRENRERPP
jgi:formamidopyrimidine-DNA glycosylase